MNIRILSPVDRESRKGNGVTVRRWERILTNLGHAVEVTQSVTGDPADLFVALHARRSAEGIRRFREQHPDTPIVLALTGTDLYRDIRNNDRARESLDLADRLIVLQEKGLEELTPDQQEKAHVIHQSIQSVPWSSESVTDFSPDTFNVVQLAHLRPVKDPFLVEQATRELPDDSEINVWHLGEEREDGYAEKARQLSDENPRYEWLGGRPRREARQWLAEADLMVIASKLEGGAHVVSEAIACETPVLGSNIPGNIGLLADDYEGYFEVEDETELANQLHKAERDETFIRTLLDQIRNRSYFTDPALEHERWQQLIEDTQRTIV